MATQRSPVKIKKFSLREKYGRDDVVINKSTTIMPTTTDFQYKSLDNSISISTLLQVAPVQFFAIKGYLVHLSATKTSMLQGTSVRKQEGYIVNPTGYIKVIFWGNHTNTIDQGSTYFFNKLMLKQMQNHRYLNTPKHQDDCCITLANPFTEELLTVDDVSITKEITATILGISNINRYISCCSCSRKVNIKGKLAVCQSIKMSQKTSNCNVQWFLHIYMQSSTPPKQKISLTLYNDVVNKIFTTFNLTDTSSEGKLMESILELNEVKLSYDTKKFIYKQEKKLTLRDSRHAPRAI